MCVGAALVASLALERNCIALRCATKLRPSVLCTLLSEIFIE
jgi:hypothetical protein